jgi:hypothetical protein
MGVINHTNPGQAMRSGGGGFPPPGSSLLKMIHFYQMFG